MGQGDNLLTPLVSALHGEGRLRVWSLVITIFGDSIQPRGGRVSAARLQEILGRLGIEAGALRTAMSRLVKEGWVERERDGRLSFYRLSPKGVAEFEPATRRIYSDGSAAAEAWVLALVPNRADLSGGIAMPGGARLWPSGEAPAESVLAQAGAVVLRGALDPLPLAAMRNLAGPGAEADYARLMADFAPLGRGRIEAMAPLDALAARTLLIHRWRRLVLRCPDLPATLVPADWPARQARALVADLYGRLVAVSDPWLDAALPGGITGLPAPDPGFSARFGGLQSSR